MRPTTATMLLLLVAGTANAAPETTAIQMDDVRDLTTSAEYAGPTETKNLKLTNLSDGVNYTSWAADNIDGGAWLKYRFAGTRYVSQISVIPGCAGSNRTFAEFGVPTKLRLESAGGRHVDVELSRSRKPQIVEVDPPLPAMLLTVRVIGHRPGKRNAVCFTELALREQTALGQLTEATRAKLETAAAGLAADDAAVHVKTLVTMGPAAVPRLMLALAETDETVLENALAALSAIGAPSGATGLLRFWKAGPSDALRVAAIRALARTGHNIAIPAVAAALAAEDFDVADEATKHVGGFGSDILPAIAPLLRSKHEDVVHRALSSLRRVRNEAVVGMAAPFARHKYSKMRVAAAHALASASGSHEQAFELLRTLASDAVWTVRLAVVDGLRGQTTAEARVVLGKLLRDDEEAVASQALAALAADSGAIRYLASYLVEEHAPLGNEVIRVLSKSKSVSALSAMLSALSRGEARFRSALQDGIAKFGKDGMRQLLDKALAEEDLEADAEAVLIKNPADAVALADGVVSRDPTATPKFVIRALGKGHAAGSLAVLDKVWNAGKPSLQLEVVKAWGHYPGAAVKDRLLASMQGPDPVLRAEAARSASKAGVKEAAAVLVRALKKHHIPADVVIDGLAKLDSKEAVPYMLENFKGARMGERLAILRACSKLQTAPCLRLLYDATQDTDPTIRYEAMKLLADN